MCVLDIVKLVFSKKIVNKFSLDGYITTILIAYFYFYNKTLCAFFFIYCELCECKNSLACDNRYYPKQSHEPSSKIYIERKHFPSQFRDSKSKGRKKDPVCVSSRNILCPVSLLYSVPLDHADPRLPELWGRIKFGNESSRTSRRFRIYRGKKTHVQIMWQILIFLHRTKLRRKEGLR